MDTTASTEGKIRDLWQSVWAEGGTQLTAVLRDRYTIEAYQSMRPFFTSADKKILEAGCGTGRFCTLLAGDLPESTIAGIDVAETSIQRARELTAECGHRNVSFQSASVFALPYPDGEFDVVFSQGVIPLFGADGQFSAREAVREMVRVTRPGGRVLVSVANWMCLPHTLYKWRLHRKGISYEYGFERSYTPHELARLLSEAGLRELEFSGFYPAYGFYRVASHVRHFRRTLRTLGKWVEQVDTRWLARTFGFEIVAVGKKPAAREAAP